MAQMKISPSRVPSLLRRLLPTLSDSGPVTVGYRSKNLKSGSMVEIAKWDDIPKTNFSGSDSSCFIKAKSINAR